MYIWWFLYSKPFPLNSQVTLNIFIIEGSGLLGIRSARKSAGFTAVKLAEMLGVSRIAIYQWECGDIIPTGRHLIRLSELLGVTVDELLKGNGHGERVDTKERPDEGTS